MKQVAWRMLTSRLTNDSTHLELYLECNDQNVPFRHKVYYSFKLISSADARYEVFSGNNIAVFSKKYQGWGLEKFVSFADLNDETKKLMTNDMITIKLDAKFVD